jgi:F-type H+-transporting ATPase subunit epsilon
MAQLRVELVSPEKRVYSGDALMVSARTLEGDIGILPNHAPLLGVLVDGVVKIKAVDGDEKSFNVHGGFISVANNRVSILGESTD